MGAHDQVYEAARQGLGAWINLDALWAATFVAAGAITLFS